MYNVGIWKCIHQKFPFETTHYLNCREARGEEKKMGMGGAGTSKGKKGGAKGKKQQVEWKNVKRRIKCAVMSRSPVEFIIL